MSRTLVLLFVVLAASLTACGGKTGIYKQDYAGPITLTLVNQTPRAIEAIHIFPRGTTDRGTSWTPPLAPGATDTVKIRAGLFELVAISARRRVDATSTEVPEATTMLELKGDLRLVFHDADQTVPGLDARGTLGVTFQLTAGSQAPADPAEPSTEPAPAPAP